MKKIICELQIGTLKQNVFIYNDSDKDDASITKFELILEDIPNFIVKQNDITDIFLTGASIKYLQKVEKDVKKLENKLYSQSTKKFHYI